MSRKFNQIVRRLLMANVFAVVLFAAKFYENVEFFAYEERNIEVNCCGSPQVTSVNQFFCDERQDMSDDARRHEFKGNFVRESNLFRQSRAAFK